MAQTPAKPSWWTRSVCGLTLAACSVFFAGLCAAVSWLVLVVFLGGCAVGYPLKSDGTPDLSNPNVGVGLGTANAAGAGLLSLGGLLSGNPAVVGLAALVANQVGKRQGWTEYEEDTLKKRGVVATTEKSI